MDYNTNNPFSLSFYKQNKIEHNKSFNYSSKVIEMKPIYSTNEELMCGIIEYNNKTYLVDLKDKDQIINFQKKFVFMTENDVYPSYNYNEQKINYLQFLYNFKQDNVNYVFKNGNIFDLRRCNVEYFHIYHSNMINKYDTVEYIPGHFSKNGVDPYHMKNPIWKINENDKEYLLMYCEKDTICKLCPKSYQKILDFENNNNEGKKITFHKHSNGYILSSNQSLFIHQVILGCYGNGKGTKHISVDHIDRNPLNNTLENLRIATRKEQEQNCKGIAPETKRERKHNAKDLPEGINHNIMKKYVVYYHEWLDKEHTKQREFFRVEHPKLDKPWSSTKSNKVSIEDKLAQANKVVEDLENNIYPEKNNPTLPKYVSLVIAREKPHLVFEKRTDEKRLNIKMVLPSEYDLQEQLEILNDKIKAKYEDETIF
jgi:hypothetical protein